jgi:hypothetical protein
MADIQPAEYCFDATSFWFKWGILEPVNESFEVRDKKELNPSDVRYGIQEEIIESYKAFIEENRVSLAQIAKPLQKQSLDQYLWDFDQAISQLSTENPLTQKIEQLNKKYFDLVQTTPGDVTGLIALGYFNQN